MERRWSDKATGSNGGESMKPRPGACAVAARKGTREAGLVGFQARTTRARPGYKAGLK